jgi:hypothetical protein
LVATTDTATHAGTGTALEVGNISMTGTAEPVLASTLVTTADIATG